jgi:hypothetical protein
VCGKNEEGGSVGEEGETSSRGVVRVEEGCSDRGRRENGEKGRRDELAQQMG